MARFEKFSKLPTVSFPRSAFDLSEGHTTSIDQGDLVPIYCRDVLPGDTFKINYRAVLRQSSPTPSIPVFGLLYHDIRAFYVPLRLVALAERIFGENVNGPWAVNIGDRPKLPAIRSDTGAEFSCKTIDYNDITDVKQRVAMLNDYLGTVQGNIQEPSPFQDGIVSEWNSYSSANTGRIRMNAVYHLAYNLIWTEWYRDQNLQNPAYFPTTRIDGRDTAINMSQFPLRKACKLHDYFTSCLPAPQKGAEVYMPLHGLVPVRTDPAIAVPPGNRPGYELGWNSTRGVNLSPFQNIGIDASGSEPKGTTFSRSVTGSLPTITGLEPNNLWADMSKAPGLGTTINELRFAVQLQKMLEADARFGSRMPEFILAHFGVRCADGRLQRPEYLGGQRQPLFQHEVPQTSESASSPQGNITSFGKTNIGGYITSQSFTEHGIIMIMVCVKNVRQYTQGIPKHFSRREFLDFYDPRLAHIGEQPVMNQEIYFDGSDIPTAVGGVTSNTETFGFNRAWADYCYSINKVSGIMRQQRSQALYSATYADRYLSRPYLSSDWIQEDWKNVDRTLAIPSQGRGYQFFADYWFDITAIRPIPLHGEPGFMDHDKAPWSGGV